MNKLSLVNAFLRAVSTKYLYPCVCFRWEVTFDTLMSNDRLRKLLKTRLRRIKSRRQSVRGFLMSERLGKVSKKYKNNYNGIFHLGNLPTHPNTLLLLEKLLQVIQKYGTFFFFHIFLKPSLDSIMINNMILLSLVSVSGQRWCHNSRGWQRDTCVM